MDSAKKAELFPPIDFDQFHLGQLPEEAGDLGSFGVAIWDS